MKQIFKILKNIQNEHQEKTGGFLLLLALLPLIFGGIGAAGGIAGGISSAVSATKNARAADANLAETQQHNKEVESQLKSGQGILSDLAGKILVFGAVIKYRLQQLVLGLSGCNKIAKGERICLDKELYLKHIGSGWFLEPQGAGFF